MVEMIGMMMIHFPFAAAAMSLQSEHARDRFACLCSAFRKYRPDSLLIKAKRQARSPRPR